MEKMCWRGLPETEFIWHGEWSDAEILYKGIYINATDIEERIYKDYQADVCEGYSKSFNEWLFDCGAVYLTGILDDYIE